MDGKHVSNQRPTLCLAVGDVRIRPECIARMLEVMLLLDCGEQVLVDVKFGELLELNNPTRHGLPVGSATRIRIKTACRDCCERQIPYTLRTTMLNSSIKSKHRRHRLWCPSSRLTQLWPSAEPWLIGRDTMSHSVAGRVQQ